MLNNLVTSSLLSWQGRAPRREFLRTYASLIIPEFFIGLIATLTASELLAWILWSFYVFFAIAIVFLVIRRLHDIQKSGWWILLLSLPGANLYIIYLLFIKRGSV